MFSSKVSTVAVTLLSDALTTLAEPCQQLKPSYADGITRL
jgi:hypothetical protein